MESVDRFSLFIGQNFWDSESIDRFHHFFFKILSRLRKFFALLYTENAQKFYSNHNHTYYEKKNKNTSPRTAPAISSSRLKNPTATSVNDSDKKL